MKTKIAGQAKLRKILLRLPALFIAAFIWFLSSQSILPQPKGILGFDKFQHLLAYAALAAAAGLWASPVFWKRRPFAALSLTALISSAYGAVDEAHQYFVPGRNCNVWDWIADSLGAALGAAAMMIVMAHLRRNGRAIPGTASN
ncbi:MAG: VanZ family protein [Treponema sp.]|nr:VanZ family protein [Treponema sp.]